MDMETSSRSLYKLASSATQGHDTPTSTSTRKKTVDVTVKGQ